MKQKRYWLRGGVIGGVIGLLISIRLAFGLANFTCQFSGGCVNDFPRLLTFLHPSSFVTAFILILPPCIIVGMIMAWIYGKIKNRQRGAIMK